MDLGELPRFGHQAPDMDLGELPRFGYHQPEKPKIIPLGEFDPLAIAQALGSCWRCHETSTDVRMIWAIDDKKNVWKVCVNPQRQEVIVRPFPLDWTDNQTAVTRVSRFTLDQTDLQNPSVTFSGIVSGKNSVCILSSTQIEIKIEGENPKITLLQTHPIV